jgi:hypothetical protein
MMQLTVGAIYEHVKTGNRYKLLALAKDSDLKEIVVYEALYNNTVSKVWVRPKEEFLGEAKSPDGTFHPRFRLVE